MKKLDRPFTGVIPPATSSFPPRSLASQWAVFNHMASHYRKLLNVKSRVDSAAPTTASKSKSNCNKASSLSTAYLKGPYSQPVSKGSKNPPAPTNSNKAPMTPPTKMKALTKSKVKVAYEDGYYNSLSETLSSSMASAAASSKKKKVIISKNNKKGASSHYSLLYGPSSLRSSSDAMHSPTTEEPSSSSTSSTSSTSLQRVETMGVAEKIAVFLENLHNNEGNNKISKKSTNNPPKKQQSTPAPLPPKRVIKTALSSSASSAGGVNKNKTLPPSPLRRSATANPLLPPRPYPPRTAPPPKMLLSEALLLCKDGGNSKKTIVKTRQAESESLMGTKYDDEAFLDEDNVPIKLSSRRKLVDPDTIQLMEDTITHLKTSKMSRSSSAGYQSGGGTKGTPSSCHLSTTKSLMRGVGGAPLKKDASSRDSAYYGFSSGGESHTRESSTTPEKDKTTTRKVIPKKKMDKEEEEGRYRSTLSTVASSIIVELVGGTSSGRGDIDDDNVRTGVSSKIRKERRSTHQGTRESNSSDSSYLSFLTTVTEDIVTRGIYTNKGLKAIFSDHLEKNKGALDTSRMVDMLESLRIDLGIPKDDSLDKIEFGYGSILPEKREAEGTYKMMTSNSTEGPDLGKTLKAGIALGIEMGIMGMSDDGSFAKKQSSQRRLKGRLLKGESDILEGDREETNENHSESSVSETEMRKALKEVGIDSETTLEIVDVVKNIKKKDHNH